MPKVFTIPIAPLVQDNKQSHPTWLNWFNALWRNINKAPYITSGIVAPTSTPEKIGDMYIDTVLFKVYVSTGTASSADWQILN